MDMILILKAFLLLSVANGAPVLAKRLLGTHLARPIDGGARLADGRPWFGPSKTFRGVVASITMTTAIAPLIGISWQLGLLTAILAMTGDLVASFVKRRLGYQPSERASGLDQISESLLPAVAIASFLPLTLSEIAAVVLLFSVASPIASRLLFHIGIRDKPY